MKRLKVIADSEYGKWRDLLDLPTTRAQDDACLALEEAGQKFLVDFGYENAEDKLGYLREQRLMGVPDYFVD